jgi:5-hydroxyisourate hydrolase
MGDLTTHVLDSARGRAAAGVAVEVARLGPDGRPGEALARARTGADGRLARPLLEGTALTRGVYELSFELGSYFAPLTASQGEPPFLDRITVRFGVADETQHYHVPLVVSPYSYTTYRGA